MRVIAGSAKSLPLKTVEGMDTRPTTDRIKETLFNMLATSLCDGRFLDLFSGSGAIGIEALSRGAQYCIFVENNRKAVQCIEANLTFTHLREQAKVMMCDVQMAISQLSGKEAPFDLIFMDPPYGKGLEELALRSLAASSLVDEHTTIIVEAANGTNFDYLESLGYQVRKKKQYKTNFHLFIEKI